MKTTKKIRLSRETLHNLSSLRDVTGGVKTIPISVCVETCAKLCNPTGPPVCSAKAICGQ